jgi:hypothetical protein
VRFRAYVTVLIITACATLSGAENQNSIFRIPDPEEITEAFEQGFIEFQDYRELLEIARSDFLTGEDSAYLRLFPDLMVGLSSNPLFASATLPEPTNDDKRKKDSNRRQSMLFRQYVKLNDDEQRKELVRIHSEYSLIMLHADYEKGYSDEYKWNRRFVSCAFTSDWSMNIGNFKERTGLGLVYGYHGQLLSKSYDRDDNERLLYPHYGGGNGILVKNARQNGILKIFYDTDRNRDFRKDLAAITCPLPGWIKRPALTILYGRLNNRKINRYESIWLASISGTAKGKGFQAEWELAGSKYHGRIPLAAAFQFRWQRRRSYLNLAGWTYDSDYPSFFSGGPSSRRSMSYYIEDINLSYSDRYRGERGLIIKMSQPIMADTRLRSAAGYARRGFDDDRIEIRLGMTTRLYENYKVAVDGYWRSDRLFSDVRKQRKVQWQLSKNGPIFGGRIAIGHLYYEYSGRDDFFLMIEGKYPVRWGKLSLLAKIDRLYLDKLANRYLYVTACFETALGGDLHSFVKYTYRYYRDEPEKSYGTIRFDLSWVIE